MSMADNDDASFSDWESVDDERRDVSGKESGKQQQIVVELPPDGFDVNLEVLVPTAAAATAAANNICSDDSAVCSSTSSFVPISQVESTSIPSKKPPSATSSYHYNSSDDSLSLMSNFEILSLSSGELVRRCKRCKYHNKNDSVVCASCALALVANPNVEMDAQIALHLRAKEEEDARIMLLEAEKARDRMHNDPLYDHASILAKDIADVCKDSFEILSKEDMEPLALAFIKQALEPSPKRAFFAYKCTHHNMLKCIRSRGFTADQQFGMVEVSHSLNDALDRVELLRTKRGEQLCSIPEIGVGTSSFSCLCWVVAIVQSKSTGTSSDDMYTCCPPAQTLPVAYFDTSFYKDGHGLSMLVQSLQDTFREFFVTSLELPIEIVGNHYSSNVLNGIVHTVAECDSACHEKCGGDEEVKQLHRYDAKPSEQIRKTATIGPPLDPLPFQPANIQKCIRTTVRIQNQEKPKEVLILTSMFSSVDSILCPNQHNVRHSDGDEEDSLSESDFSDSSSDVSSLEERGSHEHGSRHGHVMKAYWLQKDPIHENHHGVFTSYIFYAKVLHKADLNWTLSGEVVAIKAVSWQCVRASRNRLSEDFVKEIAALQHVAKWHDTDMPGKSTMESIKESHVMSADTIMSDETHAYIVMPFCDGGDLCERVAESVGMKFSENEARYWFKHILKGLESLQLMKICHRDLSPENLMIFDGKSLVIDFGMCLRIPYSDDGRHLFTSQSPCGKLPHMAPELLKTEPFDGHAVDLWAAGTILLFMLTGKRLQNPPLLDQVLDHVELGVSNEAADLLKKMLRLDPVNRLSLEEVKNHPFVHGCLQNDVQAKKYEVKEVELMSGDAEKANEMKENKSFISGHAVASRELTICDLEYYKQCDCGLDRPACGACGNGWARRQQFAIDGKIGALNENQEFYLCVSGMTTEMEERKTSISGHDGTSPEDETKPAHKRCKVTGFKMEVYQNDVEMVGSMSQVENLSNDKSPDSIQSIHERSPKPNNRARQNDESKMAPARLLKMNSSVVAITALGTGGVALCCNDGNIYLLDTHFSVYKSITGCSHWLSCIESAHPNEDSGNVLIATGNMKGAIAVYRHIAGSNDEISTAVFDNGQRKPIMGLRFLPKGTAIAATNWVRECQLWSLKDNSCICSLKGQQPEKWCDPQIGFQLTVASFSVNGNSLASATEGSDFIHIWQINNGKVQQLAGHYPSPDLIGRQEYRIRALSFSADGKYLASGANDCTIRIWDVHTDDIKCVNVIQVGAAISCVSFSPDSKLVSGGCTNGAVKVWSALEDNEIMQTFSSNTGSIKSVIFLTEKTVATIGWTDCAIKVWTLESVK